PLRQILKQRPKPRCDAELRNYMPFSPGVRLRVVGPAQPAEILSPPPGGAEPFPPRVIVAWGRFEDYPAGGEHEGLGLGVQYRFEPGFTYTKVEWPGGGLAFDEVGHDNSGLGVSGAISEAAPRDKLGGWPHWVQAPEYVRCPRCRERMTYLFQLDSQDHIPYLFGDMGCGHIFRCATHPDLFAFTWECS